MAINKVIYGNDTLIDLTSDTVDSSNLLSGYTAHDRSGAQIAGSVVTADVIDNLTSTSTTDALSANQGRVLNENKIDKRASEEQTTTSGDFSTVNGGKLESCVIAFEPKQSGSGTPSPSNVRPITGHSSVEVTNVGKNKLLMTVSGIKSFNTSGTWSGNDYTLNGVTFTILTDNDGNVTGIKANGTASYVTTLYVYGLNVSTLADIPITSDVICSTNVLGSSSTYRGVVWKQSGGEYIDDRTVSISQGDTLYGFGVRINTGYNAQNLIFYPMIRLATESDATFAPYQGQDITVNLGGTYYGGKYDFVSGKLTVDLKNVDMGSLDWQYDSGNARFYCNVSDLIVEPGDYVSGVICSCYPTISTPITSASDTTKAIAKYSTSNAMRRLYVKDTSYTDATTFKTSVTGLKVVYKLATPITIQLTPQQINTLIGENHLDVPLEGQSLDSAVYREMLAWDDVEDIVGERVAKSDIVDNLTTNDATKVLSAKQGKVLQDTKVNISDIKDNLTSTDTNKPLSAKQGKVLDEKIDGLYTESTNNEPYTLRQGKGDMVDMELVGGSFAWNQLVDNTYYIATQETHGLTFTNNGDGSISISGTVNEAYTYNYLTILVGITFVRGTHVYFIAPSKKIPHRIGIAGFSTSVNANAEGGFAKLDGSGTWYNGLYVEAKLNDTFNISNVKFNVIDLTKLFGTTIADAIYAMEQATSGSGVAFFRKYFPKDYYAYQSGKIESVNVSARRARGFNLVDAKNLEKGRFSTSGVWTDDVSGNNWRINDYIPVSPNVDYYFKIANGYSLYTTNINVYFYDKNKTFISYLYNIGNSIQKTPSNCYYMTFADYFTTARSEKPVGNCINVSDTNKNGTYEPYNGYYVYPMPNEQLRGLFTLENGKLKADGDILDSSGKLTRKFGIVDLGGLDWILVDTNDANKKRLRALLSEAGKAVANNVIGHIICPVYASVSANATYTCILGISADNTGNYIYVYDPLQQDKDAFKTAMNGVYLVYELATPTTESALPFQNPQRSDANGTEEFIDFGVSASTRDVSIPVGHNSTYKSSEVIQPLEDYVDGAIEAIPVVSKTANGLCPQLPNELTTTKFLRQDGTWQTPPDTVTEKLYATGTFTSSTSTQTVVTVTNSNISIDSNTSIEVHANVFGMHVEDISVTGSGTSASISVTFPITDTAQTISYKVIIKTI